MRSHEAMPRLLLHLEGGAVLAGSLVLYLHEGFGWLALVLLLLAPDLAMIGEHVGAAAYDVAYTEILPIVLGVAGGSLAVQLALIWLAHIGLDRLAGYGLEYPNGFKDTHLQRV